MMPNLRTPHPKTLRCRPENAEQPNADKPAEGAAPETPAAEPKSDGPAPQSNLSRSLNGELLALADANQDEAAQPAAEATPAAAEAKPDEPKTDAPAADQPATEAAPADEAQKQKDESAKALEDKLSGDKAADSINIQRYDPLEKVEPTIRKTLAGQAAAKKMSEALDGVRTKMAKYGSERSRWEVKRESDKSLPPPKEPDFEALGKREQARAAYHAAGFGERTGRVRRNRRFAS